MIFVCINDYKVTSVSSFTFKKNVKYNFEPQSLRSTSIRSEFNYFYFESQESIMIGITIGEEDFIKNFISLSEWRNLNIEKLLNN